MNFAQVSSEVEKSIREDQTEHCIRQVVGCYWSFAFIGFIIAIKECLDKGFSLEIVVKSIFGFPVAMGSVYIFGLTVRELFRMIRRR